MNSTKRIDARGCNQQGEPIDYLFECEELPAELRKHAQSSVGYYYTDETSHDTMRYGGKLAADPDLNLAGKKVDRDVMLMLAKGFSPDGKPLCQNAGQEPTEVVKTDSKGNPVLDKDGQPETLWQGGHRVGFDITFSAPKPVSVAFALAEPKEQMELLTAHRNAVKKAMDYLESKVETRRGKGGKDAMDIEGLIYSQHDHMSNRDLEPNLHTHSLVYGICKGVDGDWGTFEAKELFRHQQASDQIYRNELASELRKLNYGIEQKVELDIDQQETGRIWWTINGVNDELCDKFSNRRKELLEYAAEHGVSNQEACLATRKHKDEPAFAEMKAMWEKTYAEMVEKDNTLEIPKIEDLKGREDKFVEPKTHAELLEQLHKTEAVFSEQNLVQTIGNAWSGRIDQTELMEKIEEFKQDAGLVRIQGEAIHDDDKGQRLARRHTEDRFAANWMVEFEEEVMHRAQKRMDETHVRVAPETTQKAMTDYEARKGFQLSDEQRRAIEHITNETGGVCVMSGLAGTGKTTVSDCYSDAFKAEGKRMVGVCISNAAAELLQNESGMPCTSVAMALHQLDKGKMKLTDQDVVVLDEAGMVPTRETRRLMVHCENAGAKLILMGDSHQLQPVGAGSGMHLVQSTTGDVVLQDIRRQKTDQERATAKLFYDQDEQGNVIQKDGVKSRKEVSDKSAKIFDALQAGGHIQEYRDSSRATEALLEDYFKSSRPTAEKLVLAHTREDVANLNAAIRAELQNRGEISKEEISIQARDNQAKAWHQLKLAPGDLVRFGAKDDGLGVINGTKGQIEAIKKNAFQGGFDLTVRIQSEGPDDGRMLTFNHHEYNALHHRYGTTLHASQGQGKEQVFHKAHTGMTDNQSMLVGYTRQKGKYRLYASSDELESIRDRLGMDRLKTNATQEGVKPEQGQEPQSQSVERAAPWHDPAPHIRVKRPKVSPEFEEVAEKSADQIGTRLRHDNDQLTEKFRQRVEERRQERNRSLTR